MLRSAKPPLRLGCGNSEFYKEQKSKLPLDKDRVFIDGGTPTV
jgi:hypothetical protein